MRRTDLRPINTMLPNSQIQARRAIAEHLQGTFKDTVGNCVVLETEDPERFEKLLASLIEEFQPRTYMERMLVTTMAVYRWRLIRNGAMQIACQKIPDCADRVLPILQREKRTLKAQHTRARRSFLESLRAGRRRA